MRSVVKAGIALVVAIGALGAAAQVLARRRTVGDETADEFEIATYVGGVERTCRATSLRRGVVDVVCGGVELDLRGATLAPEGATLDLSATWGGIEVLVPPAWKVVVESRSVLGGFDARVTPPDELPDDAPRLDVTVTARLGGVSISADDPAAESRRSSAPG
jgi:hypothetical protein